jgi:endonuclease/exonuclease/phosphatase family metal-dependent hydrolase
MTVNTLHFATLNLWNWDHQRDSRIERAAEWVRASGVEVLCVQEANVGDNVSVLSALSGRCDLRLATPEYHNGAPTPTAVLTSLPATNAAVIDLDLGPVTRETRLATIVDVETSAGPLVVCSVHLAWGGTAEPTRLAQVQHLVSHVNSRFGGRDTDHPAIIAGDFNTGPDSETYRYLTGNTVHAPSTYWTDAWSSRAADQHDGATSNAENPYVEAMAALHRPGPNGTLRRGMLPSRRIDFIFSRGWRYGRAFSPSDTTVVKNPTVSDHYALSTRLLLPPAP